ncbi:MAG: HIT family protein [Candidatus ainarchaeum sp.]|jgi:diadenosine tetraphosphate (Ap4A) HIT family hydrolase|nr:HIT family protein [Candidatus ainarchaeum sp.]
MKECVFCKIADKKLQASIIYEDKDFIAILDGHPNTEGQTLVLTKKHYSSYVFNLSDKVYTELLLVSKKVAKILEKGLKVKKIAMVFEGQGVDHIHTKLYPMHKINDKKFGELSGGVYFEKYPGYITTLVGPAIDQKSREKTLKKILKNNFLK